MRCALTYFDACGFNSGMSKLSTNPKIANIINAAHILLAIFFALFKVCLVIKFSTDVRLLKAINFILQYSAALYTNLSIILDGNLQKRKHRRFWAIVEQIDAQNNFNFTSSILKFFLCSFTSVLAILLLFIVGTTPSDNDVIYMYMFLFKIAEARFFHYILCMEVVQFQLKTIQNVLTNQKLDIRRIKWIRDYYHSVYQMMDLLNNIFGWSNVALILCCFYFFIADVNWVYIHFVEQSYWLFISNAYIYDF